MSQQKTNVMSEAFLMEMYYTCMHSEYALAVVMEHVKKEYLPDKDFIKLHMSLYSHYKEYKKPPAYSILEQNLMGNKGALNLLSDMYETAKILDIDQMVEQLEEYIKIVRFQKAYKEAGELYNKSEHDKASMKLQEYSEWVQSFSLRSSEFIDVVDTFSLRFKRNRQRHNDINKLLPITRFYIDALDEMNGGRNLRKQLTCFMAPSGVGKSHIARWIGKNACQMDGLNVLHFQLEGSADEATDAYSASLVACNSFRYETGTIRDAEIARYEELLEGISGKLYVKSYPKFNCHVSTIDIRNSIYDFRKHFGISPDVVIIDSIDLLTDSSGRQWGEAGERHKRVAVANDLKDLASDENVWMVGTYQSTIENREWLNDEKNVLTEYNSSEAKGIVRPLTHLITLNCSDREDKEKTMRLYVAKSRFFKKGEPIKIATDYEHEQFYDRQRTMNLNKLN